MTSIYDLHPAEGPIIVCRLSIEEALIAICVKGLDTHMLWHIPLVVGEAVGCEPVLDSLGADLILVGDSKDLTVDVL